MPIWVRTPDGRNVRKDQPDMEPLTDAELAARCWNDVVRHWIDKQAARALEWRRRP